MSLLRALAKGITLVGVCLYGFAWLFVASLLRTFGLSPSDAGFDFSSLVARTGSVAFVLVCAVVIPLHATNAWNWQSQGRVGDLRWCHRLVVLCHLALWLGGVSLLYVASPLEVGRSLQALATLAVVGLLFAVATAWIGGTTLNALGYTARTGYGPALQDSHSDSARIVVLAVFALAVALAGVVLGEHYGDEIERGRDVDLLVIRFPSVDITYQSADGSVRNLSACSTVLLGTADGRTLAYDSTAKRVLRIESESSVLVFSGARPPDLNCVETERRRKADGA